MYGLIHTHTEREGGVLWKTDRNQQTTQIRNHCSFLVCVCLCMNLCHCNAVGMNRNVPKSLVETSSGECKVL